MLNIAVYSDLSRIVQAGEFTLKHKKRSIDEIHQERSLRYAKATAQFIKTRHTIGLTETAELFNLTDVDIASRLTKMGVIVLKLDDDCLVPTFQFSADNDVFTQIHPLLKEIQHRQRHVIELCLFLTEPRTFQIRPYEFGASISLDDIAKIEREQEMTFSGIPMDLLHQGRFEVFEVVKNSWLNIDNYEW